jgi:hypothetical protein
MEAMKLMMDLYKSIMSLATDGGIVERAMKMVKALEPLPGESIPSDTEDADIIESEEDIPNEAEEDLKEEE